MKKERSEFSSKMLEIAKQAMELTGKGSKRSVIIIATESDDENTCATIAMAGNSKDLSQGIAEFATRDQTKRIFASGLKMAQHKMMASAIGDMFSKS